MNRSLFIIAGVVTIFAARAYGQDGATSERLSGTYYGQSYTNGPAPTVLPNGRNQQADTEAEVIGLFPKLAAGVLADHEYRQAQANSKYPLPPQFQMGAVYGSRIGAPDPEYDFSYSRFLLPAQNTHIDAKSSTEKVATLSNGDLKWKNRLDNWVRAQSLGMQTLVDTYQALRGDGNKDVRTNFHLVHDTKGALTRIDMQLDLYNADSGKVEVRQTVSFSPDQMEDELRNATILQYLAKTTEHYALAANITQVLDAATGRMISNDPATTAATADRSVRTVSQPVVKVTTYGSGSRGPVDAVYDETK